MASDFDKTIANQIVSNVRLYKLSYMEKNFLREAISEALAKRTRQDAQLCQSGADLAGDDLPQARKFLSIAANAIKHQGWVAWEDSDTIYGG